MEGESTPARFQGIWEGDLISKLQTALAKKLPHTGQMLNVLKLKMSRRFATEPEASFFLYVDGDVVDPADLEDPFVLCVQQPNFHGMYSILIHAPVIPSSRMVEAFDNFVEWERIPLFPATPQLFCDRYLKELCLKWGAAPKEHECQAWALNRHIAMAANMEYRYYDVNGDRVEVRKLNAENVDQALNTELMKVWLHPKSMEQIELSILNLTTIGAFVGNKLAAFGMLSPVGLMNNVWTENAFRRRGFALVVMQSLGRAVAEMGCIPMAEPTVLNDSSRQLLVKAGFAYVQNTNWVTFRPKE